MKKMAIIAILSMLSCSPTRPDRTETPKSIPGTLHLISGPAHYLLNGDLVAEVQPAQGNVRGVSFVNGTQVPIIAARLGSCGSTTNITGRGSPYIVYFHKPSGYDGDRQILAVGVDRMETTRDIPPEMHGHELIKWRRTEWKPAISAMPKQEIAMCDQIQGPKGLRKAWSGGTMICDYETHTPGRECYMEIPIHGTTWMTEFYLLQGEEPTDQMSYARRFIESIHAKDDAHVSTTFSPLDPLHPDGSLDRLRAQEATKRAANASRGS